MTFVIYDLCAAQYVRCSIDKPGFLSSFEFLLAVVTPETSLYLFMVNTIMYFK